MQERNLTIFRRALSNTSLPKTVGVMVGQSNCHAANVLARGKVFGPLLTARPSRGRAHHG